MVNVKDERDLIPLEFTDLDLCEFLKVFDFFKAYIQMIKICQKELGIIEAVEFAYQYCLAVALL